MKTRLTDQAAAGLHLSNLQHLRRRVLQAGLCAGFVLGACRTLNAGWDWPEPITRESRPWTYWWWMASAVDETNITMHLETFHKAGLGGVHIIPIYGAKGYEDRYIEYLSPRWMGVLKHTVSEAKRLGMGVDMTTGSGWCFGGPRVTDREANASVQLSRYSFIPGQRWTNKVDFTAAQAVVARTPGGRVIDLSAALKKSVVEEVLAKPGSGADSGSWELFVVGQRPSGQKVKRAGPGGQGHMLNLFYTGAMRHYLEWFEEAFEQYDGPGLRAMYHDSYEYRSDWSPDLFDQFQKLRGYRLQEEIPVLFGGEDQERAARVRADYRETLSDLMVEGSLPLWVRWSRGHGYLTRNQAHGSPGNWLDLYSVVDIPETEMFHTDRNRLISKFASSAAHVSGKRYTAAETGTWLKEHFTEQLSDMKYLLDDLFLSGVNHVVYHGSCYSPADAPWPGWLFYASFEMNSRNSVWRDVDALNAYVARCQSVLQAGRPDNDVLLYWPIHDFWQLTDGLARNMSVHTRDWFEGQPIGKVAEDLWQAGYAFDYVSDRQLRRVKVKRDRLGGNYELALSREPVNKAVEAASARYRAVVVPATGVIPERSMRWLLELAEAGGTVIFEKQIPGDVPGQGRLTERREELRRIVGRITRNRTSSNGQETVTYPVGKGRVLVGGVKSALKETGVRREALFDRPGLMAIRRATSRGNYYFVANRSEKKVEEWIPLACQGRTVEILDPLSGRLGTARVRAGSGSGQSVWLNLGPGGSAILRCLNREPSTRVEPWPEWQPSGPGVELTGTWQVKFTAGGPELPKEIRTEKLASWTALGDERARRFAGTAVYSLDFDMSTHPEGVWRLDLGQVYQSARVRLNGAELGTFIVPPFTVTVGNLKTRGNKLEVEVTNVSANRVRWMDAQKIAWKTFHDINFVNLNYKPFDASGWPLTDSGLLGPVSITPLSAPTAQGASN